MNKYTLVAYKEIECDYDEYYSAPNVPVNNMSGVTIAGKTYSYSTEHLNELFLQNQRFDYIINPLNIVGCHQELQICDRIN